LEKEMEKTNSGYISCWTILILSTIAFTAGILLPL
jgi:hypothetical protein